MIYVFHSCNCTNVGYVKHLINLLDFFLYYYEFIHIESTYHKIYMYRNHFQCNLCIFNVNSIILECVSLHVLARIVNDKLYYDLMLGIVKYRRS